MRTPFIVLLLLGLAAAAAPAQNATTALSALRLIPRPEAKRLVRIEAREGAVTPERWYFIVHDPQGENGLREYVVAGGEIVAMRGLSQFAESVAPEEIVGGDAVKIDSDRVAAIAQQYAKANGATAAAVNYELRRDTTAESAVWTVTCVDKSGKRLGEVVFDADKGTVISHGGFAREPAPDKAQSPRHERRPRDRETELASPTPRRVVARNPPPRAEPVRQAPEERNPVRRIGNSFQRLFGGGRDR